MNGGVDAIVTFNLRDYDKVPGMFNTEVILPAEAVRRIRDV